MNQKIPCANPHCRSPFVPDLRVRNQRYCGQKECQGLRKRHWQQEKMKTDPDYRKNQQESQQCWVEQNRDYWRKYRANHPPYIGLGTLLTTLTTSTRIIEKEEMTQRGQVSTLNMVQGNEEKRVLNVET